MAYKHYHFIGIGGIGMGTLASLVLAQGSRVSGSDIKENELTAKLKIQGAKIFIGHKPTNVSGADCVVYSSAIRMNNPEMIEAASRNIPILRRAELLAKLVNSQTGITVAGAHGKTTTTSMISNLLLHAGLQPSIAVGGIINNTGSSAQLGSGQYFVAEVDESDGTFLYFNPAISVITNIDFEHIDYYQTFEKILEAYSQFIGRTRKDGRLVVCGEDEQLRKLVQKQNIPALFYGLSSQFDVYAKDINTRGYRSSFECFAQGKKLGIIELNVPGKHNILNAMACVAVGLNLDIDFAIIQKSFKDFCGVKRRFQLKGEFDDIMVVDDYGHHPTEIEATLKAAHSFNKKRVVAVFQPHRYSRTKFLMDEFAKALALSDYLILTDIYAASEKPIEGVSSQELLKKIVLRMSDKVIYLKKERILEHLLHVVQKGDLLITLGAGDVTTLSDEFVKEYRERVARDRSHREIIV